MKRYQTIIFALVVIIAGSAFTVSSDKYFEIMKNIEIFSNVYKELNTNYVDEVDPAQLMRTGIDAMTESLDPYTNYISEAQVENYRISTDGKYNGAGAASALVDGVVTVTEIYEGGGAQKAGLKVGDQIVKVEGRNTAGKTNAEVLKVMRGTEGSSISMTVKRIGEVQPIDFEIARSQVDIPNVPYSGIVGEDVGYVALTTFSADAGKNVAKAIKNLKKDKELSGVILDLRDNGGGLLREAIALCNVFVKQGIPVVSTRGKIRERDKVYRTKANALDEDIPVVVLINGRSASASEIVSGVIQDLDRGVILGKRSYGKGLVQNTSDVGYNSRLKLTISKYYIPSGRCIQSVSYDEHGEPIDISDADRAVFYTNNKRKVLDGGGVAPDVLSAEANVPGILKTLKEDHMILKFLNEYCQNKDSIASPLEYNFTDYTQFKSFLSKENFKYVGEGSEEIAELDSIAKAESYSDAVVSQISAVSNKITNESADDLEEFEAEIVDEIEYQLAARYYYEKGKIQQALNTDVEITQAIDIINNTAEYNKVLANK